MSYCLVREWIYDLFEKHIYKSKSTYNSEICTVEVDIWNYCALHALLIDHDKNKKNHLHTMTETI